MRGGCCISPAFGSIPILYLLRGTCFFPKFKRLGKIIKFFVQYITVFCLITQQNTNQSTNLYSCLT